MTALTLAEVGERWPEAIVLWDRDVAAHVDWTVIFRAPVVAGRPGHWAEPLLRADDAACKHDGRCHCLVWDGSTWATVSHSVGRAQRIQRDIEAGRFYIPQGSIIPDGIEYPRWPEETRVRSIHNFTGPRLVTCVCGHPRDDHDMWGSGPCLECQCSLFAEPAASAPPGAGNSAGNSAESPGPADDGQS